MKRVFSSISDWVFRAQGNACSWISASQSWLFVRVMKKILRALIICILALGGAIVGTITGAIKGQTTETGLLRGAGVGAVAGSITAVQLMDLMVNGEPFSKVGLLCSLVNGKIFMEWVSPAVLKAYQFQISTMETSLVEMADIFDVNTSKGLSTDVIQNLPIYKFHATQTFSPCHETSCSICLQDFENGNSMRLLPICKHSFHLDCVDQWLLRQGTCPVCREEVSLLREDEIRAF